MTYIKKKDNLLIGDRTAEEIKLTIDSAYPMNEEQSMTVKGRNLYDGRPKDINITSQEVRDALADPLNTIIEAVKNTLEKTPPELSADIIDHGIVITGGGAMIKGIDMLIMQHTGMPVHIAENQLDYVAHGAGNRLGQPVGVQYKHNRS
jgi:rod shape-determining protein MreB